MKKTILFLCTVILFSTLLPAAESDPLAFYDSELIRFQYQTAGGLNLAFKGQTTGISFGIPKTFAEALGSYPETDELLQDYNRKNFWGNVLLWGGLAAALGGAYYPLIVEEEPWTNFEASSAIMIGGLVTELIGAFIMPSGYQDLFNAVNQYNRNRMRDYSALE